eukprot:10076108-Alexandrium_andersonii.AAC.1
MGASDGADSPAGTTRDRDPLGNHDNEWQACANKSARSRMTHRRDSNRAVMIFATDRARASSEHVYTCARRRASTIVRPTPHDPLTKYDASHRSSNALKR